MKKTSEKRSSCSLTRESPRHPFVVCVVSLQHLCVLLTKCLWSEGLECQRSEGGRRRSQREVHTVIEGKEEPQTMITPSSYQSLLQTWGSNVKSHRKETTQVEDKSTLFSPAKHHNEEKKKKMLPRLETRVETKGTTFLCLVFANKSFNCSTSTYTVCVHNFQHVISSPLIFILSPLSVCLLRQTET